MSNSQTFTRFGKANSEIWIDKISNAEAEILFAFFGQSFNLDLFQKALDYYGSTTIDFWRKQGLEVHFLPKVRFDQDINYPGWKSKPGHWFWDMLKERKIGVRPFSRPIDILNRINMDGEVVLVDTWPKPSYCGPIDSPDQNDFLGSVIKELRKRGKINPCPIGMNTRFGVSADEWEDVIRSAYAERMGFDTFRVRLERVIEANVFPQLYSSTARVNDGKTNSWVWCEEYFLLEETRKMCRMSTTSSDRGGLEAIFYNDSDHNWIHRAFRPIFILAL